MKILRILFKIEKKEISTTKKIAKNNNSENDRFNIVIKNDNLEEFRNLEIKDKNKIKSLLFENNASKCLKHFFSQNFMIFTENEINKIKEILAIGYEYSIDDAISDDDYEIFNLLVKIELIKNKS